MQFVIGMICHLKLESMGQSGREWALQNGLTAEQMGKKMIQMIDYLFDVNKETRPTYTLTPVENKKYKKQE
jgi:hypothetical protein